MQAISTFNVQSSFYRWFHKIRQSYRLLMKLSAGGGTNHNMKLNLENVIFINLLFRIFLLIYLLKEDRHERPGNGKAFKHWLDPISKRVILIFINGLNRDFLSQNSTPFLKEMLDNYGAFGVVLTRYMQTNNEGMKMVLTGKDTPSFPFSWMDTNCPDNILDYVTFSCMMGSFPPELSWKCRIPEKNPLQNAHKFPELFEKKKRKSSLYVMSYDLDPFSIRDYQSRLRRIDEDIRIFANMVDSFHEDNRTTYIVTSARGTPVGKSLTTDAPVVTWGNGIGYYGEITYLKQTDLAAMLCALLGINFPSGMFAVIPMSMMNLVDFYEYELTLYTIRHFEAMMGDTVVKDHLFDSSELELEQLGRRLQDLINEIKKEKIIKKGTNCLLLILLLTVWGVNLISYASCGFACFFWHLKSLFLLVIVVGTTLTYGLLGLELLIALELLLFCTLQNNKQIREGFDKNASVILEAFLATFAVVTVVGSIGNRIAVPLMLGPVILWPLTDGSYRRLNRFVFFTRLLSGIVLGALPLSRVFGEMPDRLVTASVSVLFLINFYFLITVFNREFDLYMKVNFVVILATTVHVCLIRQYKFPWLRDTLSCLFLSFSFASVYVTSGTLLEKFFKILLALFIPVLMLTIRQECIFYLSVVFHLFTWIFIAYHNTNPVQYQFYPSIFCIEAKKPLKEARFSSDDALHIVFFFIYAHVFYLAIGHFPDLHSYDLYVVPTFIFQYPYVMSYFLGGLKFFLPFFILTTSYLTLCLVREKNYKPMIVVSAWVSDFIGCILIVYSQLVNRLLQRTVFSAKFSYFIIQQFATTSVLLSYFLAKYLLLDSDKLWQRIFHKRNIGQ